MAKLLCTGKETGSFQGYNYYKIHFSEVISNNGEGYRPITFQRRDDKGDYVKIVGLSCTQFVYDHIGVGAEYDSSKFLYDEKNKLAMVGE